MPKLAEDQVAGRMALVEDAALSLFRERGFHGVGLREIAEGAGVSLGNIYNYYEGKEAIFESVFERLYAEFAAPEEPLQQYLARCSFPDDIAEMGAAIGKMVERHGDYLTLLYIDIAEFGGVHARPHYARAMSNFEAVLAPRFAELRGRGGPDPAVVFTAIYMQFSNYFIVERLIGAKGHLGLSDAKAIAALTELFERGVGHWSAGKGV